MRRRLSMGAIGFLLLAVQAGVSVVDAGAKARRLEPRVPVDPAFSGCSEG